MAIINFPASPTDGQVFTAGDHTWIFSSIGAGGPGAWKLQAQTVTGPTGPTGATGATGATGGTQLTTKGDLLTRDSSALARLGVGTNNYVLTADSAETLGIKWAAASGGMSLLDTQTFTSSTTYSAVAGAKLYVIQIYGSGGGGGGGGGGNSTAQAGGGTGGTGGGYISITSTASELGSSITVTIGAGGTGGAGQSGGSSGDTGAVGGVTLFGSYSLMGSSGGGGGGNSVRDQNTVKGILSDFFKQLEFTTAGTFAASSPLKLFAGGGIGNATSTPNAGRVNIRGGGGGGGGGGINGVTSQAGAAGGTSYDDASSAVTYSGTVYTVASGGGGAGGAIATAGTAGGAKQGGGGAGGNNSTGLTGGVGGAPSGGGGGGSGVNQGATGGTGGAGGRGEVKIWVFG